MQDKERVSEKREEANLKFKLQNGKCKIKKI